jgi:hypothetical protein
MRQIIKKLPPDRADYSFGELVYWHFFDYGTRPTGDPDHKAGRRWGRKEAYDALGITDRGFRNWLNDENPPRDIVRLCEVLFGDNARWDDRRIELQEKFDRISAPGEGRDASPKTDAPTLDEAPASPEAPPPADPELPVDETLNPEAGEPPEASEPPAPEIGHSLAPRSSGPGPRPLPRHAVRAFVAGLAVLLGIYGWVQWTRNGDKPGLRPEKPVAEIAPPKAPTPDAGVSEQPRPEALPAPSKQAAVPPVEQPAPRQEPLPPPPQKPESPKPEAQPIQPRPPREPTQEEKTVAARQAAHDLEMRRRDEEAVQLDAQPQDGSKEQHDRDHEARDVAGLGFRLRENMSVPGSSFRNMLTETVPDCALACVREKCDAFGYQRARPRYCYLFRKPYTVSNYPGYVLGERVPDPSSGEIPARDGSAVIGAPIRLAQTGPADTTPAISDGITRCSGGPVKVTGFTLTCDQIMGGGTTLGSARLSYTVSNINECAAKCRPIAACVGFTFTNRSVF